MKTLWARVGVKFEVSETEYKELLGEAIDEYGHYNDVDLDVDKDYLISHMAEIEGDSYIPATIFEEEEFE